MNQQNRNLQAYIGHVLDLYQIASFNFKNPRSYTKFRQIKSLQKRTNASVFIETGTFLGVTTKRCVPIFSKLYTIELDKQLAEQAKSFLSNNKNVEVIQGDSLEVLPQLLERKEIDNALVFLDGHFSGGVTACGDLPEPAIQELNILAKYKNKIKCIIIDDFRSFGSEPGLPKKFELLKAVENQFYEYQTTVYLDQLIIAKI
ncbi:MAG: rRNA adenine N-6-methyltransferase family protein [Heteroscytonema crispum UTEX LB 1556]